MTKAQHAMTTLHCSASSSTLSVGFASQLDACPCRHERHRSPVLQRHLPQPLHVLQRICQCTGAPIGQCLATLLAVHCMLPGVGMRIGCHCAVVGVCCWRVRWCRHFGATMPELQRKVTATCNTWHLKLPRHEAIPLPYNLLLALRLPTNPSRSRCASSSSSSPSSPRCLCLPTWACRWPPCRCALQAAASAFVVAMHARLCPFAHARCVLPCGLAYLLMLFMRVRHTLKAAFRPPAQYLPCPSAPFVTSPSSTPSTLACSSLASRSRC